LETAKRSFGLGTDAPAVGATVSLDVVVVVVVDFVPWIPKGKLAATEAGDALLFSCSDRGEGKDEAVGVKEVASALLFVEFEHRKSGCCGCCFSFRSCISIHGFGFCDCLSGRSCSCSW